MYEKLWRTLTKKIKIYKKVYGQYIRNILFENKPGRLRPGASDFSPHPRGSTKAKIRSKGINNKGGTTNSQNGISGKKGRNINNSNKNRTASPPAEDDEGRHCHKSAILKNHRLG